MRPGKATLFILFALGVLLVPLASEAQQTEKIWRMGLFHVGLDHDPPSLAPLRETARRPGYRVG